MDLNHRPTTYKDAALTGLSYAPISPALQHFYAPLGNPMNGNLMPRCVLPMKLGRICFSKVTCILLNQTHEWGFLSRLVPKCREAIHAVGYAAPWVRCSPQLSPTRSWDFTNVRFVYVLLACKGCGNADFYRSHVMKYSGDSSAGQMHPPLLHRFNAPLTWGTVFCASSFHAHEMVDPFYGGAAHSSSYPPTHCTWRTCRIFGSYPSGC